MKLYGASISRFEILEDYDVSMGIKKGFLHQNNRKTVDFCRI
jgi:hypothetical protein